MLCTACHKQRHSDRRPTGPKWRNLLKTDAEGDPKRYTTYIYSLLPILIPFGIAILLRIISLGSLGIEKPIPFLSYADTLLLDARLLLNGISLLLFPMGLSPIQQITQTMTTADIDASIIRFSMFDMQTLGIGFILTGLAMYVLFQHKLQKHLFRQKRRNPSQRKKSKSCKARQNVGLYFR